MPKENNELSQGSAPFILLITFLAFLLLCLGVPALAGTPQMVSRLGIQTSPPFGGNGDSCLPVLSLDGRFVLFASTANNLVVASNGLPIPSLSQARFNAFLRDRTNQTPVLISLNLTGTAGGNGDSFPIAISTNGQFALFESSASDLVAADTNNISDIFVRDLVNGITLLVSANTNSRPGGGISRGSVMTPDGRYVAFVSEASDLVPGDTNRIADVFVRDLQAAVTTLVSVGAQSTNPAALSPASSSESPEITPDGRFVAFDSTATNLVSGVRNVGDIYVRDLAAGTTTWASSGMRAKLQSALGTTNGNCYNLALSTDGKFVAYQASRSPLPASTYSGIVLRYGLDTGVTELVHTNAATSIPLSKETRYLDLTPDGRYVAFVANTNDVQGKTTCIQVWDGNSGALTLASRNLSGTVPQDSVSIWPAIDPSGRYVAFLSNASGLTTNPIFGTWHLYRSDLLTTNTILVDADTNGVSSSVTSASVLRLSADGRFVAFEAADGNLVANDNNHRLDVFVRDIVAGTNELISARHPALASASLNGLSLMSAFATSADGRYIAFASEADNLVTGDTNGVRDVFVRDLATGTNWLVSMALDGSVGNGISYEPAISGNGRFVAFTSTATNLVVGDTNKASDIFVRDLQSSTTVLGSVKSTATVPGNKASSSPALSADGRWLLFRSQATDLVSGSFNPGTENLFLRDLQSATTWALTGSGVSAAAMTPDGRFAAFVGGPQGGGAAYLYLWDSAQAARVFTNATLGIATVAISPDGNRLATVTATQLFLTDRLANTNWLVSALATNSQTFPQLSADGRRLAYSKMSGTVRQVYLHDVQSQTEHLLSHDLNSNADGSDNSDGPVISPDGRFVAYRTLATNILSLGIGLARQIVLYDQQTGANALVSTSQRKAGPGDDHSLRASFSADGQTLLVQSWASDLASGDFNRTGDVYAYTIFTAMILPAATPGQAPWISWPFVPGLNYRVQFKTNLSDYGWQDLPGTISNIGVKALLQDSSPAIDRRFYRVEAD